MLSPSTLLVRLRLKNQPGRVRFGQVSEASGTHPIVELLDGDPLAGSAQPTGERLDYTPEAWQKSPGDGVELLCPVLPTKIVGVGSNYRKHAREMGKPIPEEPILFLKPPSAMLSPGRPIVRPVGYERVDYEGELAVVVGKQLFKQAPGAVADYILGYTILNDVTVRDLQKKDGQFTRAKGFDTFCPFGPAVATGFDPATMRLTTRKNGSVVQDSDGDELIFSVFQLLSFISQVMTLEPGDIVSTGTPAGVGNLVPGDVVEISIPGIGTLRNPVIGPDAAPPAHS
jgi:2-keto-4-pentenoate hydratase/2-oxohepta-3-ene-1,7-dioic acid hydratase in catechol pathway